MTNRRTLLKGASGLLLRPMVQASGVSAFASNGVAAASHTDWTLVPPQSQGFVDTELNAALAKGVDVPGLRGVVVVRQGQLVAERYFAGAQASDLHPINSATKSVASILVGQALAQGKIKNLGQSVASLLPSGMVPPDAPAAAITLGQILTGTTGLAFNFMTQYRDLAAAADPVGYVMNLPKSNPSANVWSYNDAAVSLLTPILEHAHEMPLGEVAKRDLFEPLGIERFGGQRDRAGRVTVYAGMQLRTRDLVKLAWLMANGGHWNGHRLVSADWVAESCQSHAIPDWRVRPVAAMGYGYLWFTGKLGDVPVVWAWGYGAQFSLLAPSLNLAIATSATSPPPADLPAQNHAVMALVAEVVGLAT